MPNPPNQNRAFRFGLFEFDTSTGELRKDGKLRPRLQGQPLEILTFLLGRQGDLVTREELRQKLWPADTFVDYDHSLNAAVNKLREALNDSAENPRFIQTIPRKGYRFMGGAVIAGEPDVSPSPKTTAETGIASTEKNRPSLLSDADELPAASRSTVRTLFSLIQVMYLGFYLISLAAFHVVEFQLARMWPHSKWFFVLILITAAAGIPVRLYLLTAALFGYRGLSARFLTLFPALLALDEFWALAPFLLADRIGIGLALAATAALCYLPFSQRSLLLMGSPKAD